MPQISNSPNPEARFSEVQTDQAAQPYRGAPYSQAIATEGFIFASGQIGLDPSSGLLVEGAIAEQIDQIFANLASILEAAGSSVRHIVKSTVYLANIGDYDAMNAAYAGHIGTPRPARTTVQALLPAGALIEIDVIAAR
jgi:2-iminobutanoate/2-iminopropanoate deaminase